MANIWAVLNGQPSFADLCSMSIDEVMQWHARAVARAPRGGS